MQHVDARHDGHRGSRPARRLYVGHVLIGRGEGGRGARSVGHRHVDIGLPGLRARARVLQRRDGRGEQRIDGLGAGSGSGGGWANVGRAKATTAAARVRVRA